MSQPLNTLPKSESSPSHASSESTANTLSALSSAATLSSLCPVEVRDAIQRCLPQPYDKVEKLIFKLAREWRALACEDGCPIGCREFVRLWHEASCDVLSISFDEAWLFFLDASPRVKFPKGTGPIEVVFARAREIEPPSAALRYTEEKIRLLVTLCHELQIEAGQKPFFLSCRTAGSLLGVPHKTANIFLRGLCREGILEEIAKGGIFARGKLATRWRFVARLIEPVDHCC